MTESGTPAKEEHGHTSNRADSIFSVVFFSVMGLLFVLSLLSWTVWGQTVEGIGLIQLAFVNVVVLIAAIVVGMAGFGMAQVTNGLLPLYISASVGNIMFTPLAFISVGRTFWSVRQHFRFRNTLFPVLGLLPGLPLGTYFFAQMTNDQLIIAIAVVLLLSVLIIGAVRQLNIVQQWVQNSGWSPGWKTGLSAGGDCRYLGRCGGDSRAAHDSLRLGDDGGGALGSRGGEGGVYLLFPGAHALPAAQPRRRGGVEHRPYGDGRAGPAGTFDRHLELPPIGE